MKTEQEIEEAYLLLQANLEIDCHDEKAREMWAASVNILGWILGVKDRSDLVENVLRQSKRYHDQIKRTA